AHRDRALSRRRSGALRRVGDARLRAGPDGGPRHRRRPRRRAHVHADFRARREHPLNDLEALEKELGCNPAQFVEHLSERLRMAPIGLAELRACEPAFEALPYAEALRRNCVAVRASDGMLLVALGNPYDLDTQDWIEARLREPFGYRVAHRLDVSAYLSQQEAQLRALDGISKTIAGSGGRADATQDISLESAAEAD